ncbi:acyl-ACP desaturase [Candidatus Pacearchaeota archaeon CG10_big_fil_rev_8_21_14_0_10_32_14]|nr:MAG: acyl-ACP desaturase [Candidatus Pacearchaeota archaeon CG10_big_fil_rev_8_21_14_0_10_32_14]
MKNQIEVISSLESYVDEELPRLLPKLENRWQPSDFLPSPENENEFYEQLREFRQETQSLSDELFIVLIGDTITEEALPTYQTMFNRTQGAQDKSGVDDHAWARWSRNWTAEENQHGDLLKQFLYLTGRVNMKEVERSTFRLIKNGMDMGANDDYERLIYPAFQERATKISHDNTSLLAKSQGSSLLKRICRTIAGDESRHEETYKKFVEKIFEIDPSQAILSYANLMRTKIKMPARFMDDSPLVTKTFDTFAFVAQKIGVYTTFDYASIIENLNQRWNIHYISELKDEAAKAQEYLSSLPSRYRKLHERIIEQISQTQTPNFNWLISRDQILT